jgi:hypothetical protein
MARNKLLDPDAVDPTRVDVATAPKPRRNRKKAAAPAWVEPWTKEADARMAKRYPSPGVLLEPNEHGGHTPTSPHDNERAWDLQIHDSFGTRSRSVVLTFMRQLRELSGQGWDDQRQCWRPNETQLNAALAFVSGIRPRNEVEAALAAQMLAVHLMQMRVSAEALRFNGHIDPRTLNAASALARTFTMQMGALYRNRGKGRSTRQKIVVKHEKHIHTHQHVHVHEGGQDIGAQPLAARSKQDGARTIEQGPENTTGCAALSGPDALGSVVPLASRQR